MQFAPVLIYIAFLIKMIQDQKKITFMASLSPIQLERTFLSGSKGMVIREVLVFDLCGWPLYAMLEPQ